MRELYGMTGKQASGGEKSAGRPVLHEAARMRGIVPGAYCCIPASRT